MAKLLNRITAWADRREAEVQERKQTEVKAKQEAQDRERERNKAIFEENMRQYNAIKRLNASVL